MDDDQLRWQNVLADLALTRAEARHGGGDAHRRDYAEGRQRSLQVAIATAVLRVLGLQRLPLPLANEALRSASGWDNGFVGSPGMPLSPRDAPLNSSGGIGQLDALDVMRAR